VAGMLKEPATHVFVCRLKGMESGIEDAFTEVCKGISDDWSVIKAQIQTTGRFQVETY
jgi:benzoyl-CoA 2,3-dioxygenase component A